MSNLPKKKGKKGKYHIINPGVGIPYWSSKRRDFFIDFLKKKPSSSRGLSSFNPPSPSRKSSSVKKSPSVRRSLRNRRSASVNVGQLPTNEIKDKLGKLVEKKRKEQKIPIEEITTANDYINQLPEEERVEIQKILDYILRGNTVEAPDYALMRVPIVHRPPRPTGEKPRVEPLQRRELTLSYAKQLNKSSYASIPSRNPTYAVPNSLESS